MRWQWPRLGLGRTVVGLGFVSLLNDISSEIIYPLLPAFITQVLGATPLYLGLIEGVADSTASLVKLLSGWLSDRLQRRKGLVLIGYGLAAAARPLMGVAAAPIQVLGIRFADRLGKGLRAAPRDALLSEASVAGMRGRAFGFHRAMDHLGAVVGPLLAVGLLALLHDDYRTVFVLASIPGIASVAVLWRAVAEPRPDRAEPTVATRHDPEKLPRQFWTFLLILAIFTLGNSTDAFLLLRAQQLGIAVLVLPLLWSAFHVVKSATSLVGGALSDRVDRRYVIAAGWLLYAAVYLGFAFASTKLEAWALFAIYGLFFGLTEGVERALVADLTPAGAQGVAFGFYNLAIGIGALPASLLMGLLWEIGGPAAAFSLGAGLALLASIGLLILRPRRAALPPDR